MNYTLTDYPLLHRLGSHSRAALVSYLCSYALQHPHDAGAFEGWMTAGRAFDPYGDTRAGRRLRRRHGGKIDPE